jgi:hypothetical protein
MRFRRLREGLVFLISFFPPSPCEKQLSYLPSSVSCGLILFLVVISGSIHPIVPASVVCLCSISFLTCLILNASIYLLYHDRYML